MKTNRQSPTCPDFHYQRQASCNSRESGNPRPKIGYAILSIIVAAVACSDATADVVEYARAGVVRIVAWPAYGSGFVVDSDGHILTNAHVVDGAARLTAVFDDGTRLTARVVGTDPIRDIALIKVEPRQRQLKVLPLVTGIREGDEVVALGYPLNSTSMTVTKGIVSALIAHNGLTYIQTDAALNPGNSGGPLLNLRGEVVGMSTSVLRENDGEETEGIGFAIRSDTLRTRIELLKTSIYPAPTPTQTTRFWFSPTPTPRASSGTLYGPTSGSIDITYEDMGVGYGVFDSNTDVVDFMAEATFRTPNITGDSSLGCRFRDTRDNR